MKTDAVADPSADLSTASISQPLADQPTGTALDTPTRSQVAVQPRRRFAWIDRATPLQLAIGQWFAAAIVVYVLLCTPVLGTRKGLADITGNYGALERVALWQRSLSWLPGAEAGGRFLTLPPGVIVYSLRFGLIAMFALQAWAFWQAWNGRHTSFWRWLIGPIGAHIIMLLMVPSNADVFFYGMSGDLANQGFNPYVYPLYDFPNHPLYAYNYWVDMTTVYGPFWTDINRVIMAITGPDPFWSVMAYKIFLGVAALALAGLVYLFARRLTGNVALACAAGVLVAWQPNMMVETSGQAHNDPVMLLLMTAGVMLVVIGGTRAIRGALVLVTASAGIKYVTLPILGLIGLLRLVDRRQDRAWHKLRASWVVDGIAIVAVLVAAYLPYWSGFGILKEMFIEPGRNFSHPFWRQPGKLLDTLFSWSAAHWYYDIMRIGLQLALAGVIGLACWRFGRYLWAGPTTTRSDRATGEPLPWWTTGFLVAWAVVIAALALIPANTHAWYYMWPVVPIAILVVWLRRDREPGADLAPPRWIWVFIGLIGIMTLIYHTSVYVF